jgi:hypothetical protein
LPALSLIINSGIPRKLIGFASPISGISDATESPAQVSKNKALFSIS